MRRDDVERALDALASDVAPASADASTVMERGRRRVRQRRIAVVGVVASLFAVVAAVGVFARDDNSKTPTLRAVEHQTGPFTGERSFEIAAPTALEAWKCRNPIEFTNNGGRTWRATDLAGARDGNLLCTAVAGGTAWAVSGDDAMHERIFRIRDGGSHVDAFDFPGVGAMTTPIFVDSDHGWISVSPADRTAPRFELYRTSDGGETWSRIASGDQPSSAPSFADADVGWTINGSAVLRTANTGATWIVKHPAARASFEVVATPVGAVVWAGTPINSTHVRPFFEITTDGGASWARRQGPADFERPNAHNLFSVSDATHWQLASGSGLRVTADAGRSWDARPDMPVSNYPEMMTFPTPDVGWITNDQGEVFRTADGGRSWDNVTTGGEHPSPPAPSQPVPIPLAFVSPTEGWLCGTPTMLYTTDAGTNWKSVTVPNHAPAPPRSQLPVCAAIPGGDAWMLTASAEADGLHVVHVSDRGQNVETSAFPELPSDWTVRDLAFADRDHGWAYAKDAAGGASTMLATTDGGRTWDYNTPTRGVTVFASPDEGWAALELLPGELAHTTDGGRSWERVQLYESSGQLRPVAATGDTVVALAWSPGNADVRPAFIVAGVGGELARRGAPRDLAATPGAQITASANDADHWQVAAGSQLWTTDTGGRSWRLAADFAGVSEITSVRYLTPDLGFVAATGTGTAANGTVVWRTTDGGATWTLVDSHSPPFNSRTATGINFPGGIIGCPTHALTPPPAGNPPAGLLAAAAQYVETGPNGWQPTTSEAYPIDRNPPPGVGVVFRFQVASCGAETMANAWVVEMTGDAIDNRSYIPRAQLALSHASDGWHVFGRYH